MNKLLVVFGFVILFQHVCYAAVTRHVVDSNLGNTLAAAITAANNGDVIMLVDRGTAYSLGAAVHDVTKDLMFISDPNGNTNTATISITDSSFLKTDANGKYIFQNIKFVAAGTQAAQIVRIAGTGNAHIYFLNCQISNELAGVRKPFIRTVGAPASAGKNTIIVSHCDLDVKSVILATASPDANRELDVAILNNNIKVTHDLFNGEVATDSITFSNNKIEGSSTYVYVQSLLKKESHVFFEDNEIKQTGTKDSNVFDILATEGVINTALRNNNIFAAPQTSAALKARANILANTEASLYLSTNTWDFGISNSKATGVMELTSAGSLSTFISEDKYVNLDSGSGPQIEIGNVGQNQACTYVEKLSCYKGSQAKSCFSCFSQKQQVRIVDSTFPEISGAVVIQQAHYAGTKGTVKQSLLADNPTLASTSIAPTTGAVVAAFFGYCTTNPPTGLNSLSLAQANDDTGLFKAATTTTINVRANDVKDAVGSAGTFSMLPIGLSLAGYEVALSGADEVTHKQGSLTPLTVVGDSFYYFSRDPHGGVDVGKVVVSDESAFSFTAVGEANVGLNLYSTAPIRWTSSISSSSKLSLYLYAEDKVKQIIQLVDNVDVSAKEAIVRVHRADPLQSYYVRAEIASAVYWSEKITVRVCNTFNVARVQVCTP